MSEYQPDFVFTKAHPTHLYYGVSISGWSKFFEQHPRVKQQQAGAWNEGDIGVTIVELD